MDNRLLRLKNAKKYKGKVKLSTAKEVISEWYKKYQIGELKDERRNYLNFENLILKNLLGYKNKDFEFEYPLDGRSVEFMILKDENPYIAIELKGTNTKDLTKRHGEDKYSAVEQANNYANKKSSIKWYIVSNYYEFRLYSHESQNRYISFTLDDLKPNGYDFDEKRINQFLTVFSRESVIEKDIITKLYDKKGLFPEDFNLENEFYKLYSETRLMLIKELEEINNLGKNEAVEYAQLILNRYIFICFCEDKGLLPDNTSSNEILTPIQKKNLRRAEIWQRMNGLFIDLEDGNKEKGITDYNGGLFKEELDHLKIRDRIDDGNFYKDIGIKWSFPEQEHIIDHEIRHYPNINSIYRNLLIISSFDFNTDLTENILGHIFENSVSDLEKLKNEKESKRKKEGVYYTPEYITKYICENTIIPYLSNENNTTIESLLKEYSNNLDDLENKLYNIKIVDPACGSGAFLNKATDILLDIHKAIFNNKNRNENNLDKEFDNIDNRRDILLNNIYGVDLNNESIEITKLGLFLKVCKKGIKLPDLDKNIKCGNSLINDSDYTDKPFHWGEEFPEVIGNGGFDVVIGNPPYVGEKGNKEVFEPLFQTKWGNKFSEKMEKMDLIYFFFHKSIDIAKKGGLISFITTNYFITANGALNLRTDFKERTAILSLLNFNELKIFDNAKGQHNIITILKKTTNKDIFAKNFITNKKSNISPDIIRTILEGKDDETDYFKVKQENLFEGKFNYLRLMGIGNSSSGNEKIDKILKILNKVKENGIIITEKCEVKTGLRTGIDKISKSHLNKINTALKKDFEKYSSVFNVKNSYNLNENVFIVSSNFYKSVPINERDLLKPLFKNSDIKRYYNEEHTDKYVIYTNKDTKIDKYPYIEKHLLRFKPLIELIRGENGEKWYSIVRPRESRIFISQKITIPQRSKFNNFSYNENDFYASSDVYFIIDKEEPSNINLKYVLSLINSKLYYHWFYYKGKRKGDNFELYKTPLSEIYIKDISLEQQKPFIELVNKILHYQKEYHNEINSFHKYLFSDFNLVKINEKVVKYYNLSFEDLYKEVRKQYKEITRREKDKLEKEYISSLEVIQPLQKEIKNIDKEIDNLVYKLYDLTDEEIKIIENTFVK